MSIQSLDKNQCWTALKYTKLQQFKMTPAFKDPLENIAISMKDKEAMVQKTVFLPPPKSILRKPRIPIGIAHLTITKKQVYNTLIAQSTQKAPGPNKINFGILCMICN